MILQDLRSCKSVRRSFAPSPGAAPGPTAGWGAKLPRTASPAAQMPDIGNERGLFYSFADSQSSTARRMAAVSMCPQG